MDYGEVLKRILEGRLEIQEASTRLKEFKIE